MSSMTPPSQRLDYLDGVRAFALLLGVVFHASMSFVPFFIGWAVMDISTSSIVSSFIMVSHSFRMELFFLIAGFLSHMTFHRKGSRSFIHSRLIRIAIPFVVGWFILRPLVVASWIMGGESVRGEVRILNAFKMGIQSLSELPTGILTGSHLWFLYYLLLITTIVLAVRAIAGLIPRLNSTLKNKTDLIVAGIVNSRFSWIILALPTAVCLWNMSTWGMDTPDKSLKPHWPALIIYGGFFLFGWTLHRSEGLIAKFSQLSLGRVAVCVISICATLMLTRYQSNPGHPQFKLFYIGFSFSYAMMMWSLVSQSIGLFKRYFDKPGAAIRYVADASYWIYLVHLPIVVWLQIAFAELEFHWSLKLISISVITVGISLVMYDLFVRSTWIGKILNGKNRERVLFNAFKQISSPNKDQQLRELANSSPLTK